MNRCICLSNFPYLKTSRDTLLFLPFEKPRKSVCVAPCFSVETERKKLVDSSLILLFPLWPATSGILVHMIAKQLTDVLIYSGELLYYPPRN